MSFHYLATPYSKFEGGNLDAACRMACSVSADLIRAQVPVFSPIAHTHAIAKLGGIDPLDHGIWLPADEPMMRAACGLLIYKAPGWRRSFGIAQEVKAFRAMGKPVRAINATSINDPGVLAVLRYAATIPEPTTGGTVSRTESADERFQSAARASRSTGVGSGSPHSPVAQPEERDPSSTRDGVEAAGSSPAGAAISSQVIEEAVANALPLTDEALELPAFLRRAEQQFADMTGVV